MKQKILLLIPNLDFGGAQRVFNYLSEGLAQEFEVIECVFNLHTPPAFHSDNTLIDLNIPAGRNIFDKIFRFLQRCYSVYKVKQQYSISLTISHLEGADYVNFFSGGKIMACVHGSKIHDANITGLLGKFRMKLGIPFLYKRIKYIVAVSDGIKKELIKNFGCRSEDIVVINNGVDVQKVIEYSNTALDTSLSSFFQRNRTIISHGRLVDEKNHSLLLDIFANGDIRLQTKLVIIGDGPLRERLLDQCRKLGLRYYHPWGNETWNETFDVFFLGYQANPFKFLARAWAYALPSKYEGYPMALCEAVTCGLPVISSDCNYGPRDILKGSRNSINNEDFEITQFGVLMKSYDSRTWIAVILRMLQNEISIESLKHKVRTDLDAFSLETFNMNWRERTRQVIQSN